MRSGKANTNTNCNNSNQEDEEYDEDEFSSRKDGSSSHITNSNNNTKDGKNSDKANVTRSKHSVTEQRRRSKINERFQILRDLIPHSDQKRDTASFLLEVIEYVQYLQEKVQRYDGSYQGWSQEPTKLMPWRNSHWRAQSFVGYPPAINNGPGPSSTFPGKLDENNIIVTPSMLVSGQDQVERDQSRDLMCKTIDMQPESAKKGVHVPGGSLQASMPAPVHNDGMIALPHHRLVSDAQSSEHPVTEDSFNQQEELAIEGGTISISSAYSQGLLDSLTHALQSLGVDLSQAKISVQIDLGKRANRGLTSMDNVNLPSDNQATTHPTDASLGENSDQTYKRLKT